MVNHKIPHCTDCYKIVVNAKRRKQRKQKKLYTCEVCGEFDYEEVGLSTGENGVEKRVCGRCDIGCLDYNGWGDKEETECNVCGKEFDNEGNSEQELCDNCEQDHRNRKYAKYDESDEESEEEADECECCDSGLPAVKVQGIFVCKKCNNFECGLCGKENEDPHCDIAWNEECGMCVCDCCDDEEEEEEEEDNSEYMQEDMGECPKCDCAVKRKDLAWRSGYYLDICAKCDEDSEDEESTAKTKKTCCDCSKAFKIDAICKVSISPEMWKCFECCAIEMKKKYGIEDSEDEESVDERESPNVYPYKKCSECGERKSCGSYCDTTWFCEDCAEEEEEDCRTKPCSCGCGVLGGSCDRGVAIDNGEEDSE